MFVPIEPTRIMDTRNGTGVAAGMRAAWSSTELVVAGLANAVPADARAVVLNVTITESLGAGFVQVFPTGNGLPGDSSNLNVLGPGSTLANLVIVPVGTNGSVTFFNHAGGHLVADLFGYFADAAVSASGRFVGLAAPDRVLDTRDVFEVPIANPGDVMNCGDFGTWSAANHWYWTYKRHGDPAGLDGDGDNVPCESLPGNPGVAVIPADLFKMGALATYRLPVRTNAMPAGGVVPSSASAVVMNVTVAQPVGDGFVQIYNDDVDRGLSSNLNFTGGEIAPNLVIAPIAPDGSVKFYVHNSTHLIVDVIGYFTGPSDVTSTEGLFVPFPPDRLIDTRDLNGPLPVQAIQDVDVATPAGVDPTVMSAMFLNATIAGSAAPGFMQVYPTGNSTPGASSTVNVMGPGQIRANAAISGVSAGSVTVYLHSGGQFVLDAAGYFSSSSTPRAGGDDLLDQLTVAPQNTGVPYDRDDWPHWIDTDGDCQNTRAEVLIRDTLEAVTFTTAAECTVATGRWLDPWTGLTFTMASEVDIDHTVALANAHRSGGWAWTPAQRRDFANDLGNLDALQAMDDGTNVTKADKGPDAWKPPSAASWCRYATDWATIKVRWQLTVTGSEYAALATMLTACPA
jgi:hypothetical protein